MKLFARYNRINLAVTVGIFLLGSLAFYFVLHRVLLKQLDESLLAEQQEIEQYVVQYGKLPSIENTRQQQISITPENEALQGRRFHTFPRYNREEGEQEWIRQLEFSLLLNGKSFHVEVNRSEVETEDLLQLLVPVILGIVALIMLAGLVINRRLLTRLWQPFYSTLDVLRGYRVSEDTTLQLASTGIDEIDQLHRTLNEMAARIRRDYQVLKEHTENAAHEMQTPLAVIRSRVDQLLQHPDWSERELEQWQSIENATEKLARLNQSLLLLTKLENSQYASNEEVDLEKLAEEKLAERAEMIREKELRLTITLKPVKLYFHRQLAEIMVGNLLNNAIRYTPAGGQVNLNLDENAFTLSNQADRGPLDRDKVFQRFYKKDASEEGNGLGLALVKEIAGMAGFTAHYQFENGYHVFRILFNE